MDTFRDLVNPRYVLESLPVLEHLHTECPTVVVTIAVFDQAKQAPHPQFSPNKILILAAAT